jgi:hypothetical protein
MIFLESFADFDLGVSTSVVKTVSVARSRLEDEKILPSLVI